jgi:curved DNA-binding protein CbpA
MNDHFATLGQPRRPWLDADALKDAFHRLSASLHPDVAGTGDTARFAAVNAAHVALREPASRLRHLLELTAPESLAAASNPPLELADLFMQIAGLRRRLEAHLAKRQAATSPRTQALLASEEAELRRELQATLGRLEAAESAALEQVREIDSRWSSPTPEAIASLLRTYHRLAYLARWLAQTRESLFALGS